MWQQKNFNEFLNILGYKNKRSAKFHQFSPKEITFFFIGLFSFSELKRRLKAEQKVKEKAEKDKERAEKVAQLPNGEAKAVSAIDEAEISPNEFFKLRSAAVDELKKRPETHPYPHKFNVTISLENFIEQYSKITDGETLSETVSVAGRVHSIRLSGAKLIFYDVRGEGVKIQVMANARAYENEDSFAVDTNKVKRGDIIGIVGSPGKTKKGELSIIPKKVRFFGDFFSFVYVYNAAITLNLSIFPDPIAVTMLAHAAHSSFRP